ncbi:carboxypeptidase-like regulatory domain-containing protein [Tamlana sp. s12]|uniref:carboxypeptidase-like regulatory domain-containing protein n=1 Tax=Tamlana sp. s12 TaxID=1630406 RepID=UPI000800A010|nr:carboxypeptidase-like regulatory domain-containing protein [Tamlana sp. s12]OBQ55331.1 hypothetical protein VQ01_07560 [Tamlana sp. s12]QQY80996.1 carboxypeptidase-like regulatory domain-containing protein [Tamlana sp. s12]
MKYLLLLLLLNVTSFISYSQNFSAQIVAEDDKKAIPYATVKTNVNTGVISNEEGFFTLIISDSITSLTISCLGFEQKTIPVDQIKTEHAIIELKTAINQLDEVIISNKPLNAESIIAKVRENISSNYKNHLINHGIFSRTTNYADFKKLDFEIEKASHIKKRNLQSANRELEAMAKEVKEGNIIQFEDFKGSLYVLNKDSTKIEASKATKILDSKNNFSLDDIQEKSQRIVLKYLDSSKTYKIKSGFFKLEDSLDLNDDKVQDLQKKEYQLNALNSSTRKTLRRALFYKNSFIDKLINPKLYDYTLKTTTFNETLTYVIQFTPSKERAKYTGLIYINGDSFAITQVDYDFYEDRHGKKINFKFLLGLKYIHSISNGTIIFEKNNHNLYQPKYIKHNYGSYFYANRDVKFIENSSDRYKVRFSCRLEGDNRFKQEILFTSHSNLTSEEFQNMKQNKAIEYTQLDAFDKSFWGNEEILEPLNEMKNFNVNP